MQYSRKYAVLAVLVSSLAFAQNPAQHFERDAELVGTVKVAAPNASCSVEISSLSSYSVSQRTLCDASGSFQFTQVPRGVYNLVVKSGTSEFTEELSLDGPREEVEVNIPRAQTGGGDMVSVAEMRIPEKAKKELHKAEEALAKREVDKADEHSQKALAMAPQFARAMTFRAVVMMARNDFGSALKYTEDSARIDPMLGLTQVVRASALNDVGRAKEAQAAAEQGLRLDGSWQAHYELARALLSQGHFRQALAEIAKVTAVSPPQMGELMLMRASALFNLKDMTGARDALAAFMKARPGDPRGTQMMARMNGR